MILFEIRRLACDSQTQLSPAFCAAATRRSKDTSKPPRTSRLPCRSRRPPRLGGAGPQGQLTTLPMTTAARRTPWMKTKRLETGRCVKVRLHSALTHGPCTRSMCSDLLLVHVLARTGARQSAENETAQWRRSGSRSRHALIVPPFRVAAASRFFPLYTRYAARPNVSRGARAGSGSTVSCVPSATSRPYRPSRTLVTTV